VVQRQKKDEGEKTYVYGTQNRGMADFAALKVSLSKLRLYCLL